MPFVLGNATKSGVRPVDTEDDYDAGGDIKYNVTPSLALDGTINTDFAQVEVDDQQVNLDRFNLFFPEKRPFFLENAGFFSVGNPGEVDLFFSRRIGLDAAGEAVPIIGGGRLSGKAGRYNVGLLNMQTNDVDDIVPGANFTVARVARDLPNRSSIGALFVNRVATGDLAPSGHNNQTYALDGRLGVKQNTVVSGFYARTAHLRRRWRRLRLQPAVADQPAEDRRRRRLPGGGEPVQPRSRVPDPPRLPQARRARHDPLPAEADLPGAPAARHRARLLGPRRLPGERLRPHRQPLAVQGQHRGPHRRQPDAGRPARAVRDLPGHLRARRRLQERRDPAGADDQPGAPGELQLPVQLRRLLQRVPQEHQPDAAVARRTRR